LNFQLGPFYSPLAIRHWGHSSFFYPHKINPPPFLLYLQKSFLLHFKSLLL